VALVAREPSALEAARAAVAAESGRNVLAVSADTGNDESVARMASAVAAEFGGVDILVNAAARPNTGAVVGIDAFDEAEFGAQVNVKVLGYLRCIRAVVPFMREAGWGRIVNISGLAARSTGAITGTVRNVAVAALTKNLADELGRDGINVTVVHPGVTVTESTPKMLATRAERAGVPVPEMERRIAAGVSIGRLVTAEEVASVVAFLTSPRSVAINGDAIVVSGGAIGPVYY
jgi:NAD(P)-dependent dehydrogenase (short-subunit alcohol dehydrogenase family)